MLDLSQQLIVRVIVTTAILSIISYFVIQKNMESPDRLAWAVPSLFIVFGISILVQILFVLNKSTTGGNDETRFWIAKEVSGKKEGHDASGLFRQAKQVAQMKPKVIITDGLRSYHNAYQKEFWGVKREDRTLHIRHIRLQGDMNNNKMERLNGEFRDREKVARGLKKEDSALINGYQIYHNYIRPHMGLDGKTPSEACGITIQGDNKWKTLIQNATKKAK